MPHDPRTHYAARMTALSFFENKNKLSQTFVFKLLVACVVFRSCLKPVHFYPSYTPLPTTLELKHAITSFFLLWSV